MLKIQGPVSTLTNVFLRYFSSHSHRVIVSSLQTIQVHHGPKKDGLRKVLHFNQRSITASTTSRYIKKLAGQSSSSLTGLASVVLSPLPGPEELDHEALAVDHPLALQHVLPAGWARWPFITTLITLRDHDLVMLPHQPDVKDDDVST